MGKFILIAGLIIAVIGALMMVGIPFGRLPGDIVVRRGRGTFYFPLATSIILSIVFSVLLAVFRR